MLILWAIIVAAASFQTLDQWQELPMSSDVQDDQQDAKVRPVYQESHEAEPTGDTVEPSEHPVPFTTSDLSATVKARVLTGKQRRFTSHKPR